MTDFKSYPARIEEGDGGFTVLFRDLPNTFTCGETKEDAFSNAKDVLEDMLTWMVKDDDAFNPPSAKQKGETDIPIPAYLVFSLLVRQYRKENGLNQTEFATMLGVTQQQVAMLEKPNKNRKMETVSEVLEKIGYHMGFFKAG